MSSSLPTDTLLALLMACAPQVAPDTGLRLVRLESGGNPWAIGVNGPYMVRPQPSSAAQAVATARALLQTPGVRSIDVGLAMINSAQFQRLGLTLERAFDPCTNLASMQWHLQDSFARAAAVHGPGQRALQQALSEYNTGHPTRGLANGYVQRLYRQPAR